MQEARVSVRCEDTYEAAFYISNGAVLLDVHVRARRGRRNTFHEQWVIDLNNVNKTDISSWREHTALGNVRACKEARLKLKERIKKILYSGTT